MSANILVVDDLEPNIKLLEAKLIHEYYTVFTATNSEEALKCLAKYEIDIVLLDVMMPGVDGFETCKLIKANPDTTNIPVIMVTALTDIEDRVKGLEAGADEFLTKPINDIALIARVKSLTRMKNVIYELKSRNKTNEQLGASTVEIIDNFQNSKIMIIIDDLFLAKNIKAMLADITVNFIVISGSEQLDNINQEQLPDLIIVSSQLEQEDCLRICVMLRSKEKFRNASLMLLIEEENSNLIVKAMELGVNDFFIYPVDSSELVARTKTQLKKKLYQDNLRNELDLSINLSIRDGLTGVFNRRYFDIHIQRMINQATESKRPLCLVMFDIDRFKKINDAYGHQIGDEILKTFANILKDNFKVTDLISRFGGEEFCVILSDITLNHALGIAERLRLIVAGTTINISSLEKPLNMSVSIGVADLKEGESAMEIFGRADAALYKAKDTGRNKVIAADT